MIWFGETLALIHALSDGGKCRKCGCTDEDCSGCIERTGEPCYWVEDDLCSACVDNV